MAVPGQVSAGYIDGFLRDDADDGTLGVPDYSLTPYRYVPLLEEAGGTPRWVVDQFRSGRYGGFKGSPDGLGTARWVGANDGAFLISLLLQDTGSRTGSPDGSRAPQYTWGPRDAVLALRHPGTASWAPGDIRAYLALTEVDRSVGIQITTPDALGPWDVEFADSHAVRIDAIRDLWDGNPHNVSVACIGPHVLCTIDGAVGIPFRAPRAYKRSFEGGTDTSVYGELPATGEYGGYDTRGLENFLYAWIALQPASGDFFYYDMGPLRIQTPPSGTYTPAALPSGETWSISGTATASKDGVLLAASSRMSFTPASSPHGYICTQWGAADPEGGLVFRRVDDANYYLVTSTGLWRYEAGVGTKVADFTVSADDHVVVQNWATYYGVFVNGVSVAVFTTTYWPDAGSIGFLSPSTGSSQFRYIGVQPVFDTPVIPS